MKSNNQINVPQAKEAVDKFKMQAAQEVGVNLQNGYNGHLTSREAGSVGGQMVNEHATRTNEVLHPEKPHKRRPLCRNPVHNPVSCLNETDLLKQMLQ